MIKRQWKGAPSCFFCQSPESVNHLLFTCSVAKSVWDIIATSLGASNIPISFNQSWLWCDMWIPNGKQFHAVGIGVVCWAIWKMRNNICFEGKTLKSPLEIISHACALMKYWAGLQSDVDKEALIDGVETMFKIAVQIVAKKRRGDNQTGAVKDSVNEDEASQDPDH